MEEVDEMTAAEAEFWREYQRRFGFPLERIMWTLANVGAAVANSWRKKENSLEPRDFIPKFRTKEEAMKLAFAQMLTAPKTPRRTRVLNPKPKPPPKKGKPNG